MRTRIVILAAMERAITLAVPEMIGRTDRMKIAKNIVLKLKDAMALPSKQIRVICVTRWNPVSATI